MRREKGVTLVALVVTIIILVILVGVTVNAMFNKGIIDNSKTAVSNYALKQAEEKLGITLAGARAEKYVNPNYNENEYLTDYIINETGAIIEENTVILDGYVFKIDRSVPKIEVSLGKASIQEEIKIEVSQDIKAPFIESEITIKITYTGEISEIKIGEESITALGEKDSNNTYTITYRAENNGIYSIVAYNKDNECNYATIAVTEVSEDMVIRTAEELAEFRDRVNKGATYEGRTVSLGNDIDLNEGKYTADTNGNLIFNNTAEQWTTIGTSEVAFKGTFDAKYHVIKGLYIDSTSEYVALFRKNEGVIKNLGVEGVINTEKKMAAGITVVNSGTIQRCYNMVKVSGKNVIGGICYSNVDTGEIIECINYGSIIGTGNDHNYGGICGGNNGGTITNCYNHGNIKGYGNVGGIVGLNNKGTITNCYNVGNVEGTKKNANGNIVQAGSLVGANGTSTTYPGGTVENCFYKKGESGVGIASNAVKTEVFEFINTEEGIDNMLKKLGTEFTADIKENGKWKYNNGYPVLKWQLEK